MYFVRVCRPRKHPLSKLVAQMSCAHEVHKQVCLLHLTSKVTLLVRPANMMTLCVRYTHHMVSPSAALTINIPVKVSKEASVYAGKGCTKNQATATPGKMCKMLLRQDLCAGVRPSLCLVCLLYSALTASAPIMVVIPATAQHRPSSGPPTPPALHASAAVPCALC